MKTADVKRAAPWRKPVALAVATLAVALSATGCGSECVDAFDCRNDNGQPPAGQEWVCREEKCVLDPIDAPETDAGTEADAGTDTDAGTDADAGTDTDAGTDAGTDPCATAAHDEKLGTLQLQAGFQVAESVSLPEDVAGVSATPGPTFNLYAVRGSGTETGIYSLGTWPNLETATTKLYDVVAPADRTAGTTVFPNGFLAFNGKQLLAGYTTLASGAPGQVLLYDVATSASSTYVNAPSNYTADAFVRQNTEAFLVNGNGLGTVSAGLGVYGLDTSADPVRAVKVANFPSEAAGSGSTAVATNDIAVLGYAVSGTFVNRAFAVPPTVVDAALSSGTPFALADQPEVELGSNFTNASTFGEGVAFLRGDFSSSTDVSRVPLSFGVGGPQTVTIGTRVPVLVFADQCTSVQLMAPLGADLLVGLDDKNGRRLVRIQQTP